MRNTHPIAYLLILPFYLFLFFFILLPIGINLSLSFTDSMQSSP